MRKLFGIGLVLLLLFGAYDIGSAIYISRTTGILDVVTDPGATITVNQAGQGMSNIGSGKTRVHLRPGSYSLIVSKDRTQNSATVQISKKSVTHKVIKLVAVSQQPQSDKAKAANLLIKLLPFYGPSKSYKVDYSYSYDGSAAEPTIIVIAPNDSGKAAALQWMKGLGFEATNLPIKYQSAPVQ